MKILATRRECTGKHANLQLYLQDIPGMSFYNFTGISIVEKEFTTMWQSQLLFWTAEDVRDFKNSFLQSPTFLKQPYGIVYWPIP